MLSINELEREISTKDLSGLYLLYGEEQFLLKTIVSKIKNKFGEKIKGINYITIDETNYQQLISDIETPAFGYEKKLIIIKNSGLLKKEGKRANLELKANKEKVSKYIKENIKMINQGCVLVFIEEDIEKKDLYKVIDQNGIVCEIPFQKPIGIEKRFKSICKAYDVEIDSQTMKYFIEACGTNMQELVNEIRKLIEYVGKGGKITKQDIDLLSTKKLESIIFDLTDNLGKKEIEKALQVLENMIYSKEPVQKIFITLYGHFKRVFFTKYALNHNKNVTEALNLKANQTFLVNKYKYQAKYFDEEELKNILQELRDVDYKSKTGNIDLYLGLQSILCRYCS